MNKQNAHIQKVPSIKSPTEWLKARMFFKFMNINRCLMCDKRASTAIFTIPFFAKQKRKLVQIVSFYWRNI